jgi:hypothetical protein
MTVIVAFSARSGDRLAEVAFLLILFAGIWLAVAQLPVLTSLTDA